MNEQDVKQNIQFNLSRLLLLGVISLVLCMSFIMSIFAPFPIAFASVVYGRRKGYGLALATWLVSFILSISTFGDLTVFLAYTASIVVAFAVTEVVLRGINPVKGLLKIGGGINLFGIFVILMMSVGMNFNFKTELVKWIKQNKAVFDLQKEKLQKADSNMKESFEAIALLSQPELLADEVIEEAPGNFFVGVFLVVWANLFLLLRSNRMFRANDDNPPEFTEVNLLNIKVPDSVIWFVIVGLLMALWGEDLGSSVPVIGMYILKVLGVFYFFQGFGVYLAFLDFAKIRGFFRTILVMLTVVTGSQLLAAVGLFDMFVNFKRFIKKNESNTK